MVSSPLTKEVVFQLEIKHPDNRDAWEEILLIGPINKIHPIVFDKIDEEMVLRAASITKSSSGPSGLDPDYWMQMLTSSSFCKTSSDLRKWIADFIKNLPSKKIKSANKLLEAFIACRLIPLNKNPGLTTIDIWEELPPIPGKMILNILNKGIMNAVGLLKFMQVKKLE